MKEFKLSKEESDRVVSKIKAYFNEELDREIGAFEAEFLIDFFAKELGPHLYNRGLSDAQTLFNERAEELSYLLEEQEMPTL